MLDAGLSRDIVFYFAQRNLGDMREYRHGLMYVEGDELGEPQESHADVTGVPYAKILNQG